jgi:hypothetical protein
MPFSYTFDPRKIFVEKQKLSAKDPMVCGSLFLHLPNFFIQPPERNPVAGAEAVRKNPLETAGFGKK